MSDTETQLKKPKMSEECKEVKAETNETLQPTCAHFVKRKKRFCKMTVSKGKQYCGEHEPAKQTLEEGVPEESERIPCPLDPKHTVYRKKLQKHLRICNARQSEVEPAYVVRGINAGVKEDTDTQEYSKLKLSELDDEEFKKVIDKVAQLFAKNVEGRIDTLECQHKPLEPELAKPEYGKEARKHLLQTSALLGILDQEQQLINDVSFIEFGAGKGQLAFYLAQTLHDHKNSQVVLLDRMSLRHKKDNKIEDKTLVHRIRVDIADFSINNLDIIQHSKRLVAVSKHLCGGATDLALRCITKSLDKNSSESEKSVPQTEFLLIALCCHHRCDWQTFVGKDFFRSNDISPREFAIITKMVGWAICGSGMSRERRRALEEQTLSGQVIEESGVNQRLSLKERERIGFMCKRVLDHARLYYLRQHKYEASLKHYVSNDVTLENVCLIAKKLQ